MLDAKEYIVMNLRILLVVATLLVAFGCKESFDHFDPDPGSPVVAPPIVEFNASAFVEVVDSDGNPIEDAGISLGMESASTNEYGVAYLKDIEMGSISYMTVDKDGYFHGSRRFYPTEGKTSYLRVMLLDEMIAGSFGAGQGGTVQSEGVVLDFPANAIMDANGNAYTGNVEVAMAAVSADDSRLSDKMPGDLVGRTLSDENAALASFGMTVVELRSPDGEALQVSTGSTVEMSMDVPPALMSGVPATIPMWSFDEAEGIWVEETVGTLNGGKYVAQIPHFTWWNYDAWFPVVKFGASFVFESGTPAQQLSVCITAAGIGASKCSLTDEEGFICGLIPSGEDILMEVKDACGNTIYEQNVGPFDEGDSVVIGPITLPETSISITNLSGEAVDCDGNAVTNGYVRASVGNGSYFFEIEDGSFSGTLINCDENDIVLNVIDEENYKQSLPQTYGYTVDLDVGTITACEDIEQIVIIEIPDLDTTLQYLFPHAFMEATWTYVSVDSNGTSGSFNMSFGGADVGTYTGSVYFDNGVDYFFSQSMEITVSYYGTSGDYVQGTFTGEVLVDGQQSGTYNVNGSFTALLY